MGKFAEFCKGETMGAFFLLLLGITHMPETLPEEAIFHAALAFESAEQRTAFLERACANQPELRRRVDALLRRYVEAQGPLDRPVSRLFATAPELVTERPGTMIGPYELIEPIG